MAGQWVRLGPELRSIFRYGLRSTRTLYFQGLLRNRTTSNRGSATILNGVGVGSAANATKPCSYFYDYNLSARPGRAAFDISASRFLSLVRSRSNAQRARIGRAASWLNADLRTCARRPF